MAFDSDRSRAVLFGGKSSTEALLRDTWEWDGSFWTQMDDIGPSARFLAAIAYDSARKVTLLFGGRGDQHLRDTWQWDGTDWTQLADSGPSARSSHAMAFDSARNRAVLFGGQGDDNSNLNDTWEFDGEEWTQQEDTGPSPRGGHAMAYDSASESVFLFGGIGAGTTSQGDTWAWDGQKWMQLAEFGPSARLQAAMARGGGSSVLLYGGLSSLDPAQPHTVFADTWEFDGKHWTLRQDIGPGPLQLASMIYDSVRSRLVLFGGTRIAAGEEGNPDPVSAGTRESLAAAGVVGVLSLAIAGEVLGEIPTTLTIKLKGPAPMTGALVNLTGPVFTPGGANLPPIVIPAGLSTMDVPVAFAGAGSVTITAEVAGTPAVSLQVLVGG